MISARFTYDGGHFSAGGTSTTEFVNLAIPYGQLESIKYMGNGPYGFLNFLEEKDAVRFYTEGQPNARGHFLRGGSVRLVINWARPLPIDPQVRRLADGGATRHLEVGKISRNASQREVASLFAGLCDIENVVLLPDRGTAVVNTMNIQSAALVRTAARAAPQPHPTRRETQSSPCPLSPCQAREKLNGKEMGGWQLKCEFCKVTPTGVEPSKSRS
jgi:hypothetical protein